MHPIKIFIDADTLHKLFLRKLLFSLATDGLVTVQWSRAVFSEAVISLQRRYPNKSKEILTMFVGYMRHFAQEQVTGFECLIGTFGCRDPNDEHVLAAAVKGNASVLLTYNLKDFQVELGSINGLQILHPDQFLELCLGSQIERSIKILSGWLALFDRPVMNAMAAAVAMEKIDCNWIANFLRFHAESIDCDGRLP